MRRPGQFATRQTIELGQLLRPFPQFGDILWTDATGAHSQYHALVLQGRKRTDGLWGATFSYTFSRLNDNQVGASNYYASAPGVQNNYVLVPWSTYYNPDSEVRAGVSSIRRISSMIAPTRAVAVRQGRKFLSNSAFADALLGGWSVTAVYQAQSGFPLGVSQNITGSQFLLGGRRVRPGSSEPIVDSADVTERIRANTTDNQYFNLAAFKAVAKNQFGNAPRTLPGVLSPFRNSFSMSAAKQVNMPGRASASVRVELLNPFNIVQWASLASSAFGNASFGQVRTQANNMRSIQFTLRVSY